MLAFAAWACASPAVAQVAVTYFPFQSVLALSTNPERRLWGSLHAATNTFISNVSLEAQGLVTVRTGEVVNYYAGPGVNVNPLAALNTLPLVNGYTLTAGARIRPLPARPGVQLVFELAPYLTRHLDGGYVRTLLGLSYSFRRRQ